jgi:anti-sigma factor RsiW
LNCKFSEESLALYVEGDLSAVQAGKVEHHLGACARCREITTELRDSLDLFKTFRGYGIDASEITDMHRRVRREIQSAEKGSPGLVLQLERAFYAGLRRKWVIAGSGAVVCALMAVSMWSFIYKIGGPLATSPRVSEVTRPPEMVLPVTPPAAAITGQSVTSMPRPNRPIKRHIDRSAEKTQPSEILVKVFTDDPNIVIYWFLEQKGEME